VEISAEERRRRFQEWVAANDVGAEEDDIEVTPRV
jgi:hypothetical protein